MDRLSIKARILALISVSLFAVVFIVIFISVSEISKELSPLNKHNKFTQVV